MKPTRLAAAPLLFLLAAIAPAHAAEAGPLEFTSSVYEGGEAWLAVRNRGDEPVTVREFRWSDSPRVIALDLVLEPRQQSSVALPRSGRPPLWLSLGDAGWISEDGARAPATAPVAAEPEPAAQGFVTVQEPGDPPPRPAPRTPSTPAPEPPPVAAADAGGWSVVLNSFLSPERARADAAAMSRLGYRAEVVAGESAGQRWYRVLIRGYATAPEARAAVGELAAKHGRFGAWILHD